MKDKFCFLKKIVFNAIIILLATNFVFASITLGIRYSSNTQQNNTNNDLSVPIQPPENDGVTTLPLTPLLPSTKYLVMIKAKTNDLAIRQKPTVNSNLLGRINTNDLVLFAEKTDGWYKTYYKNQTAYISANSKYTELIKFDMPNQDINKILQIGLRLLGTKYVFGAQRYHWGNGVLNTNFDINAFDCSSYTQYIYYKSHYILLDTTSRSQSTQGKTVQDDLKVGDVMFFTNSSRFHLTGVERVGHVGIYFGNNYILHTASDYAVVEPISKARWKNYLHSKRFI